MSDTYNVVVPVLALVEADSEEQATARLTAQLTAAGFFIYEAGPGCELVSIGALVAEPE